MGAVMTVVEWVTVTSLIGGPAVGFIVWLVKLQGAQQTHERECAIRNQSLRDWKDEMASDMKEMRDDIKSVLKAVQGR
jgi:hypothetical protein